MTKMISVIEKEAVFELKKILNAREYFVMIDETTDICTKKELAIVVRFVDINRKKVCRQQNIRAMACFNSLLHVSRTKDNLKAANDILTILKNFMKSNYVDPSILKAMNPNNWREYLDLENIYVDARREEIIQSKPQNLTAKDIHNFKVHCLKYYTELANQIRKSHKISLKKNLVDAYGDTPLVNV
ncbi:hypothetical protein BDFB_012847, partial [Asbolus verrucosus]